MEISATKIAVVKVSKGSLCIAIHNDPKATFVVRGIGISMIPKF